MSGIGGFMVLLLRGKTARPPGGSFLHAPLQTGDRPQRDWLACDTYNEGTRSGFMVAGLAGRAYYMIGRRDQDRDRICAQWDGSVPLKRHQPKSLDLSFWIRGKKGEKEKVHFCSFSRTKGRELAHGFLSAPARGEHSAKKSATSEGLDSGGFSGGRLYDHHDINSMADRPYDRDDTPGG